MANSKTPNPLSLICKAVLNGATSLHQVAQQTKLPMGTVFTQTNEACNQGLLTFTSENGGTLHQGPRLFGLTIYGQFTPVQVVDALLDLSAEGSHD